MEIKSLNKLASILKIPADYLIDVCKRAKTLYRPYKKLKKNGKGYRTIDNPSPELKRVQKRIEQYLLRPLAANLPNYMHGGRRGKSVATNASAHVSNNCLLSLDLQNCFGTITYSMAYDFYMQAFSCVPPVAKALASLTTFQNHLPQGGVTSPSLCNLITAPMMAELNEYSQDCGLLLTNYIDDIFVSGEKTSLYAAIPTLLSIINRYDFTINYQKIDIKYRYQSMRVTGVIINQKPSIGRAKIRAIERMIIKLHPTNTITSGDSSLARIKGFILYAYSINPDQGHHLANRLQLKMGRIG